MDNPMILRLFIYFMLIIMTVTNVITTDEEQFNKQIPFFVMQPHTIINQTLYSYCKEQYEFNIQSMFINLTTWPSGFIYARNPYQKFDGNNDNEALLIQDCTMELRASLGDHIRFIFYPISTIRDDYDHDYLNLVPRMPCLRIRDYDETITFDCPMMFDVSQSTPLNRHSDDYLSNSNIIYLEFIRPPNSISDYDESYHQFKLFFTRFTSKLYVGLNDDLFICPIEHLIDCDDSYCVHADARCNGINECRSKVDEDLYTYLFLF
ncbi:unnamed protein product [Rotaria magnacalcarata]|uniref:Uncharacterized protein n=2 Tax=Rotaria magnacalcarata TaxID=392030 RepID=A0A816P470_9BILA|nr:unnamed protein product [Rotaria magnacalcarata]CAF3856142.1 unnamed protein product [Rotaria magnacalcarata]CAF3981449.1 unnamed protein product [Rotaria magnacalcarata]